MPEFEQIIEKLVNGEGGAGNERLLEIIAERNVRVGGEEVTLEQLVAERVVATTTAAADVVAADGNAIFGTDDAPRTAPLLRSEVAQAIQYFSGDEALILTPPNEDQPTDLTNFAEIIKHADFSNRGQSPVIIAFEYRDRENHSISVVINTEDHKVRFADSVVHVDGAFQSFQKDFSEHLLPALIAKFGGTRTKWMDEMVEVSNEQKVKRDNFADGVEEESKHLDTFRTMLNTALGIIDAQVEWDARRKSDDEAVEVRRAGFLRKKEKIAEILGVNVGEIEGENLPAIIQSAESKFVAGGDGAEVTAARVELQKRMFCAAKLQGVLTEVEVQSAEGEAVPFYPKSRFGKYLSAEEARDRGDKLARLEAAKRLVTDDPRNVEEDQKLIHTLTLATKAFDEKASASLQAQLGITPDLEAPIPLINLDDIPEEYHALVLAVHSFLDEGLNDEELLNRICDLEEFKNANFPARTPAPEYYASNDELKQNLLHLADLSSQEDEIFIQHGWGKKKFLRYVEGNDLDVPTGDADGRHFVIWSRDKNGKDNPTYLRFEEDGGLSIVADVVVGKEDKAVYAINDTEFDNVKNIVRAASQQAVQKILEEIAEVPEKEKELDVDGLRLRKDVTKVGEDSFQKDGRRAERVPAKYAELEDVINFRDEYFEHHYQSPAPHPEELEPIKTLMMGVVAADDGALLPTDSLSKILTHAILTQKAADLSSGSLRDPKTGKPLQQIKINGNELSVAIDQEKNLHVFRSNDEIDLTTRELGSISRELGLNLDRYNVFIGGAKKGEESRRINVSKKSSESFELTKNDFKGKDCKKGEKGRIILTTKELSLEKKDQGLHHSRWGGIEFDESGKKEGEKGIFNDADLWRASFRGCKFTNVDFSKISPEILDTIVFANCEFDRKCKFPEDFQFKESSLKDTKNPARLDDPDPSPIDDPDPSPKPSRWKELAGERDRHPDRAPSA